MRSPRNTFVLTAALCCSCTAHYEVAEITGLPHGSPIAGIPFRTRIPQTLRVYRRMPDGRFEQVHEQFLELADQTRLYSIGFGADVFADGKLVVGLNEDCTLKDASLTTAITLDETIRSAAGSVSKVSDALVEAEKAKQAARDAEAKAAEAERDAAAEDQRDKENAVLAATEAFYAAQTLIAQLENLPPDTPAADVVALHGRVEVAKANANLLAQRAGLTPPY